ncbi:MAG: DUF6868 family protein [Opitutales bacterium]|jgi:hypothetical protein
MEGTVMTLEIIREILGWCTLINLGLLLWWGAAFFLMHDFVYRIHSRFFHLSMEEFDKIHYAGMACFKMMVLVFNLVPYLAMRIVG